MVITYNISIQCMRIKLMASFMWNIQECTQQANSNAYVCADFLFFFKVIFAVETLFLSFVSILNFWNFLTIIFFFLHFLPILIYTRRWISFSKNRLRSKIVYCTKNGIIFICHAFFSQFFFLTRFEACKLVRISISIIYTMGEMFVFMQ